MSSTRQIIALLVLVFSHSSLWGDMPSWGDLKIRFVYSDPAPSPTPIEMDARIGIDQPVSDESFLVNGDNRGLANVVAYLIPPSGEEVTAHPSYQARAGSRVKIEMRDGRFEPHILLLRTSQTMVQINDDVTGYAPHMMLVSNSPM
jgi:hypothetical protein